MNNKCNRKKMFKNRNKKSICRIFEQRIKYSTNSKT